MTLVTPADDSATNDSTPTFSGSAGIGPDDSPTVTVKVYSGSDTGGTLVQTLIALRDGAGAWSVDATPALADGTYTAQAEQLDLGENVGFSSANTFTVTASDITPPVVVLSAPTNGALTNDATPTFAGTAGTDPGDLSTVTVNVYQGSTLVQSRSTSADSNGDFSVDASPPLADGTYRAQAEQSDASGNIGRSAQPTFTVDTTPPSTTIDSGPTGVVSSTGATFTFSSEAGAAFECELDGGGFAACTSPKTYSGLAEGAHTFHVRARDAAGNADPTPAIRSWTVDTVAPPTPTIDSSPPDPAPTNTATFAFSDSEPGVNLRCRLDGAAFANCTSPKTYSGLGEGQHTFEVVAVDAAGNFSEAAADTLDRRYGHAQHHAHLATERQHDGRRDAAIRRYCRGGSGRLDDRHGQGLQRPAPNGHPVRTLSTTRGVGGAYAVEPTTAAGERRVHRAGGADGLGRPCGCQRPGDVHAQRFGLPGRGAGRQSTGLLPARRDRRNLGCRRNGYEPGDLRERRHARSERRARDEHEHGGRVRRCQRLRHRAALELAQRDYGRDCRGVGKADGVGPLAGCGEQAGQRAVQLENYSIWFNTLNKPVAFFGNGVSFARVDGPVLDTNWHYLVATYDNATARIYVDGTLRASTPSTVQLTPNTLPLNIGRANGNINFFGGTIDEVAVYGTALSAARIQAHYNAATTFDATAPTVTLTSPANGLGPTTRRRRSAGRRARPAETRPR